MGTTNKVKKFNFKFREVEFPEDLDTYLRSVDIVKSLDKKNLVIGCYIYDGPGDLWTTLNGYYVDDGVHTEKEVKKFMNAVIDYYNKYFDPDNLKIGYEESSNSLKFLTECIICHHLNENTEFQLVLQTNIAKYNRDKEVDFDSEDWLIKREIGILNQIESREKINRRFIDNQKEKTYERER